MKNSFIISLATLSCLSSVHAEGKFNIGIAGGFGSNRTSMHAKFYVRGRLSEAYKYKVHDKGFVGGITADYIVPKEKLIFELGIAGYLDSYRAEDKSIKSDDVGHVAYLNDALKRNYTIEASSKLGYQISPSIFAFGKLGGLYSSFKQNLIVVPGTNGDNATTGAWGGVIGAGIQKLFSPTVKVGISYDFHYYESLKVKTKPHIYTSSRQPIFGLTTMRPIYHQVYLTVSKAF